MIKCSGPPEFFTFSYCAWLCMGMGISICSRPPPLGQTLLWRSLIAGPQNSSKSPRVDPTPIPGNVGIERCIVSKPGRDNKNFDVSLYKSKIDQDYLVYWKLKKWAASGWSQVRMERIDNKLQRNACRDCRDWWGSHLQLKEIKHRKTGQIQIQRSNHAQRWQRYVCVRMPGSKWDWKQNGGHPCHIRDKRVMCCVLHVHNIFFTKRLYLLVLKFWTKPNN